MGASVRRVEDVSLLKGEGTYTTDVAGELTGYFLRSAAAHARISVNGADEARQAPGVHLVLLGSDVAELGPVACIGMGPTKDGSPIDIPPYPVLCTDTVRHVGDAIAFIVADDLNAAKSAAELIDVDYDILPAVIETGDAMKADAPLVWPDRPENLAFEYEQGDREATEAAFAAADKVAELTIVNNRLVCNYIEPRAIVAEYDADTEHYTLTLGTQGVHALRDLVSKQLGTEPDKVRVVTPEVGGGFGTKAFCYREYAVTALAAKRLGKSVKWVCERTEHFLADAHGRDHISTAAFALDADGRITAMKVDFTANMGSYLSQFGPFIPWLAIIMTTGLYDIKTALVSCKAVYTNTVPLDAYRGAGRPEAAYLVERLADEAARVCGLSRQEFRRRNFIKPDQLPYRTAMGRNYDTGEFEAHMDMALEVADLAGFEARAAESKSGGKIRGFGFATYVEACAFEGSEPAKTVLEADGTVTLHIGTQSTGQGHKTAYAQFVAEPLGLDYDRIRVIQGDTDDLPTGGGTGGSRSIPVGVPSVDKASRQLAEQIKEIASAELETAPGDIELVGGHARIVGTDRQVPLAQIAAAASDPDQLIAVGEIKQQEATYPNGTHVCELEIDPGTGTVDILKYTIVDDFGRVVNPLLLEGQVHGGIVQGIGQALFEHTVYDESGQLVTASFQDYQMPRAADLPSFDFQTRNVPSTWNVMGIKGAGEAGSIGSCPAVMNAVVDALNREYGIRNIDMPATPERVWNAIQVAS
jgi:carbon-monoxide dehydrogenase large subunit